MRPSFITQEKIQEWDVVISNDNLNVNPSLKEVIYAGLWLREELEKQNVPTELLDRIQYTAGAASFGRDTWEVSQHILHLFNTNALNFEEEKKEKIN